MELALRLQTDGLKVPAAVETGGERLREKLPAGKRRSFVRQQLGDGDAVEVKRVTNPRHALLRGFGTAQRAQKPCERLLVGRQKHGDARHRGIHGGSSVGIHLLEINLVVKALVDGVRQSHPQRIAGAFRSEVPNVDETDLRRLAGLNLHAAADHLGVQSRCR